jgi:O-antigen/teichoic acid export membrane protein
MTYMQLPIVILSAVHPVGASAYAMADKLRGYGQMALVPVAQIVQGYVPAHGGNVREHWRRIGVTLRATFVVALIACPSYILLAGPAGQIMSGGAITVGYGITIPVGVSMACVVITGVTGYADLVSLGRERTLAFSTMVGAIIGIVTCLAFGWRWGAVGAAFSALCAEGAVAAIQLWGLARARKGVASTVSDLHLAGGG